MSFRRPRDQNKRRLWGREWWHGVAILMACSKYFQVYDQESKKKSRFRVVEHAIRCLTTERDKCVCVQRCHVGKIWEKLQKADEAKAIFSMQQRLDIAKAIEDWERRHERLVQTKTPQDLRVCYLGGENPMNDIQVLLDKGILLQNITGIEKDAKKMEKAQESIDQSGFTDAKLFKGDIITFLKGRKEKFDIIYYDGCGTLPSEKQNTLNFIGTVFLEDKLTSPGALITNFSFPPATQPGQEEDEERGRLRKSTEEYLTYRLLNTYPQDEDERSKLNNIAAILKAMTDEDIYSQYITYQVIDSASVYIPALRLLLSESSGNGSLWDQLYTKKKDFLNRVKLYDTAAVRDSTSSESYLRKIGSSMKIHVSRNSLCKAWVTEILPHWRSTKFLKDQEISSLLLTHHLSHSEEFIKYFANEVYQERCLKPLGEALDPETNGSFCDTLDPASATCLVGGLLYGQQVQPSFPVVDKLLRLHYTAKTRQMFSDVFIFDKCPYLYEEFPSVHFAHSFSECQKQMLFKMILNGLSTHLKGICYQQFCNVEKLHVDHWHSIPQRQTLHGNSLDLFHEGADLQDELL